MDPKEIVEIATQVIGVLSIVASITPTPIDNVVLVTLRKILDLGAFNFGQAKNKNAPK